MTNNTNETTGEIDTLQSQYQCFYHDDFHSEGISSTLKIDTLSFDFDPKRPINWVFFIWIWQQYDRNFSFDVIVLLYWATRPSFCIPWTLLLQCIKRTYKWNIRIHFQLARGTVDEIFKWMQLFRDERTAVLFTYLLTYLLTYLQMILLFNSVKTQWINNEISLQRQWLWKAPERGKQLSETNKNTLLRARAQADTFCTG